MVKVSVIIPVYNAEKYLRVCLESVLSQSLQEFEIICVDDGSTDASMSILGKYASKDQRIRIIADHINRGQAYARNRGLNIARGQCVYFMDSDDIMKENALSILYEFLIEKDLDGILFEADVIYEDGLEKEYSYIAGRRGKYSGIRTGSNMFKTLIEHQDYRVTVWTQFWSREYLLHNNLFFHEYTSPHEDDLFSFMSILLAKRIACISASLYLYRKRVGASTTNHINEKRIMALFVGYVEMVMFLSKQDLFFEPMELLAIKHYLISSRKRIYHYIMELFHQGIDFANSRFPKHFYKTFLHTMFLCRYNQIDDFLSLEVYRQICNSKYVIVYGAGQVGKEVMNQLQTYNLENFFVAVTKRVQNQLSVDGKSIFTINDLLDYKLESLVLVAVGKTYQDEVIETLNNLGFPRYICMV